jgi:hypothetical protein
LGRASDVLIVQRDLRKPHLAFRLRRTGRGLRSQARFELLGEPEAQRHVVALDKRARIHRLEFEEDDLAVALVARSLAKIDTLTATKNPNVSSIHTCAARARQTASGQGR